MKLVKTLMSAIVLSSVVPAFGSTIATVNGAAVTAMDVRQAITGVTQGQADALLRDPMSRRNALEGAINQELLVQTAKRFKLDHSKEFKALVENFERQALANLVLQRKWESKLTPAAVHKFYRQNIGLFSTDRVHVQHIVSPTEAEAKKILALAKAPRADFQRLAEKYSRAPEAKNDRGDIGLIGHDGFDENFTHAAFSAKVGSIVGPIHTVYGYHLIKVIEKSPGKALGFAEVEARATIMLRTRLAAEYAESLRKQAKIAINEKALAQLH